MGVRLLEKTHRLELTSYIENAYNKQGATAEVHSPFRSYLLQSLFAGCLAPVGKARLLQTQMSCFRGRPSDTVRGKNITGSDRAVLSIDWR